MAPTFNERRVERSGKREKIKERRRREKETHKKTVYLPNNIQVDLHKNVIVARVLHDVFVNTQNTHTQPVCFYFFFLLPPLFNSTHVIMFMYHGTLAIRFS